MANTATAAKRQRPRKTNTSTNGEAVNDEATTDVDVNETTEEAQAKGRAKAKYHLYEEDEDGTTLRKLGDDPDKTYEGRNATEAIEAYIDDGNDAEGITFVVVPDRNLARVKAAVETKTKVKLSAA